mmetsp:Transcript_10965/g.28979  ORF Transcript_10965/g.28979 Transcript_10965/m.28979 type:complete len:208 (-) Transcript_10965:301-924(-)
MCCSSLVSLRSRPPDPLRSTCAAALMGRDWSAGLPSRCRRSTPKTSGPCRKSRVFQRCSRSPSCLWPGAFFSQSPRRRGCRAPVATAVVALSRSCCGSSPSVSSLGSTGITVARLSYWATSPQRPTRAGRLWRRRSAASSPACSARRRPRPKPTSSSRRSPHGTSAYSLVSTIRACASSAAAASTSVGRTQSTWRASSVSRRPSPSF